ncbi:MAG: hypothetical protein JXA00_02880 [Candidatus Thermoplasmatota archaeon]|nr:hypothetical protein [Candidatus Thermoplasmatota archaeon]
MKGKSKHLQTKLHDLGHTLGLNDTDIANAKQTACSMLSVALAATLVIIIGKFATTQLDAVGLYYTGVSIKDFGLLSRFF